MPCQPGPSASAKLARRGDARRRPRWLAATDDAVGIHRRRASRPTPGSPTSAARTACGPRTPRPRRSAHIDVYVADPTCGAAAWQNRLDCPDVAGSQPNAGHRALVDLQTAGHVGWIVTQNIDGLHQLAGRRPDRVLELHGTAWRTQVHALRRRAADARHARPRARGRGRPAVPRLRRHPQVGHDQLRSAARPRRARAGRRRWPRRPT